MEMTRTDFQKLSDLRVVEARALLDAGQYPGARYLIGYAVECALKACVAKQVRQYDFPDKELANKAFTHNLEQLVKAAGLEREFTEDMRSNRALDLNWAIVKDWSEAVRYEVGVTEPQARDLYSAITERDGILPWVKIRW